MTWLLLIGFMVASTLGFLLGYHITRRKLRRVLCDPDLRANQPLIRLRPARSK